MDADDIGRRFGLSLIRIIGPDLSPDTAVPKPDAEGTEIDDKLLGAVSVGIRGQDALGIVPAKLHPYSAVAEPDA